MTPFRNFVLIAAAFVLSAPGSTGEEEAGCMNTVDVACGMEEFSTLCTAVDIAGLGDALGMGNWTVFAPTNEAFAALPESVLETALNNTALLTDILLFHAVPAVISSSDLVCTQLVEMANGEDSRTVCSGSDIFQKGAGNDPSLMPKIIQTDIETCQGYIHVIGDIIMLPLLP